MKGILGSVLFLILSYQSAMAQVKAVEQPLTYQKSRQAAAVIEIQATPESIETVLRERLGKYNVKIEKNRDGLAFKNARMVPTDGDAADLYFVINDIGRGNSSQSLVQMLVGRPNENVGMRVAGDSYRIPDAIKFLDQFAPHAEAYDLRQRVARKEDEVKKTERDLKGLEDDKVILEQRLRDLQDKLMQNRKDRDRRFADLREQQEELTDLREKSDSASKRLTAAAIK